MSSEMRTFTEEQFINAVASCISRMSDSSSMTITDVWRRFGSEIGDHTSDGFHTFGELYSYRLAYNAAFLNETWMLENRMHVHPSVGRSHLHADGTRPFGGGWFIVWKHTDSGYVTNHYRDEDWDLFQIPERPVGPEWDGSTPEEELDRLMSYVRSQSPEIERKVMHL